MRKEDKKIVEDYVLNRIPYEVFKSRFSYNKEDYKKVVLESIKDAAIRKDSGDIEDFITLGFNLWVYDEDFIEVLSSLLKQEWHRMHESIVQVFDDLRAKSSVGILYETALRKYPHLEFCNSESLAYRCIFALGHIGNAEAIEKLKELSLHEEEFIRVKAIDQLKRLGV